jgi:hypothetical protein
MTDDLTTVTAQQTFDIESFTFSPTELRPRAGEFDMDQWQRLGEFIRMTNQACQWWWGDWLNMGEEKFGEHAAQALEATRWDEETLRVYAWVCRKVPPSTRVPGVPFGHYQCLAKLPEAEQRAWAEKVVDDQMSVRQLRLAIRNGDAETDTQPCVLIRCKSDADADTVEALLPDNVRSICDVERTTRARKF